MTILHKLEDFLFELFPKAKMGGNDQNILVQELQSFYTNVGGGINPKVTIENGWIKVEFDTPNFASQESE